jgi:hypothetical protein
VPGRRAHSARTDRRGASRRRADSCPRSRPSATGPLLAPERRELRRGGGCDRQRRLARGLTSLRADKPPAPARGVLRVAEHGDGWGVPARWEPGCPPPPAPRTRGPVASTRARPAPAPASAHPPRGAPAHGWPAWAPWWFRDRRRPSRLRIESAIGCTIVRGERVR